MIRLKVAAKCTLGDDSDYSASLETQYQKILTSIDTTQFPLISDVIQQLLRLLKFSQDYKLFKVGLFFDDYELLPSEKSSTLRDNDEVSLFIEYLSTSISLRDINHNDTKETLETGSLKHNTKSYEAKYDTKSIRQNAEIADTTAITPRDKKIKLVCNASSTPTISDQISISDSQSSSSSSEENVKVLSSKRRRRSRKRRRSESSIDRNKEDCFDNSPAPNPTDVKSIWAYFQSQQQQQQQQKLPQSQQSPVRKKVVKEKFPNASKRNEEHDFSQIQIIENPPKIDTSNPSRDELIVDTPTFMSMLPASSPTQVKVGCFISFRQFLLDEELMCPKLSAFVEGYVIDIQNDESINPLLLIHISSMDETKEILWEDLLDVSIAEQAVESLYPTSSNTLIAEGGDGNNAHENYDLDLLDMLAEKRTLLSLST